MSVKVENMDILTDDTASGGYDGWRLKTMPLRTKKNHVLQVEKGNDEKRNRGPKKAFKSRCHNCGEIGHKLAECDNEKKTGCYECNEEGHFARDCPRKKQRDGKDDDRDRSSRNCDTIGHKAFECMDCDTTGHKAFECTSEKRTGCGTIGHTARYCPDNDKEGTSQGFRGHCRNCDKVGHKAFECTSKKDSKSGTKKEFKGRCRNCDKRGHKSSTCKEERKSTCYGCDKEGHIARNCPQKKDKENEKDLGLFVGMCRTVNESEEGFVDSESNKREFLMDSGATCHVVIDGAMLTEVKLVKESLVVGNGDVVPITKKGTLTLSIEGAWMQLPNVRVAETFAKNIISTVCLEHAGIKVEMSDGVMTISNHTGDCTVQVLRNSKMQYCLEGSPVDDITMEETNVPVGKGKAKDDSKSTRKPSFFADTSSSEVESDEDTVVTCVTMSDLSGPETEDLRISANDKDMELREDLSGKEEASTSMEMADMEIVAEAGRKDAVEKGSLFVEKEKLVSAPASTRVKREPSTRMKRELAKLDTFYNPTKEIVEAEWETEYDSAPAAEDKEKVRAMEAEWETEYDSAPAAEDKEKGRAMELEWETEYDSAPAAEDKEKGRAMEAEWETEYEDYSAPAAENEDKEKSAWIEETANELEERIWKAAIRDFLESQTGKESCMMVSREKMKEEGHKAMGSKWIYTRKKCLHMKLVEITGVEWKLADLSEASDMSVQRVLLQGLQKKWTAEAIKVEVAFPEEGLEETVYLTWPYGVVEFGFVTEEEGEKDVMLWKERKYGPVQSPRQYVLMCGEELEKLGLIQCTIDQSVWCKMENEETVLMVVVDIDDCILTGPQEQVDWFKKGIKKKFNSKEMGPLKKHRDLSYERKSDATGEYYEVRMDDYKEKLIKDWKVWYGDNALTEREDDLVDCQVYQRFLDRVTLVVRKVAPECSDATRELAMCVNLPTREYWESMKNLMDYLESTDVHLKLGEPVVQEAGRDEEGSRLGIRQGGC